MGLKVPLESPLYTPCLVGQHKSVIIIVDFEQPHLINTLMQVNSYSYAYTNIYKLHQNSSCLTQDFWNRKAVYNNYKQ